MRILVTSASGANGNGYGAILGFGPEAEFTGPFSSDPRITDPRGLALDPSAGRPRRRHPALSGSRPHAAGQETRTGLPAR
jgi:hypothetical protein